MTPPLTKPRDPQVKLRRDLLRVGYTDKAIARLVKSRTWVRVRHGAYVEASVWDEADDDTRHLLRARAVIAQAGTEVVLSHGSALVVHGAPTWGIDLSDVHVTRKDGRTGRHEAGVDQHRGAILPGDVVRREGLEVVSAARLAIEITTVADAEAALVAVSDLLHRKLTTLEVVRERYGGMERWPGTLKTDIVLRLADPRFETVGESRCFYLFFHEHLPMPIPQYEVYDDDGRFIGRVDFAWPELGVFLEFDGKVKYEKLLKTGQRSSDVVVAEKRREELICRVTGWRCVRLIWADLARPARTAAVIRAALFPSASVA